jgi:plastocyanin
MRTISRVVGSSVLMVFTACGDGSGPGNGGGGGGGGGNCPANSVCMTAASFNPGTRTTAVNTAVIWTNSSGVVHDVVFNTPSAALGVAGGASGNFSAPSPSTNQRQFAAAGTYPYHCSIHGTPTSGMRGSIVVN